MSRVALGGEYHLQRRPRARLRRRDDVGRSAPCPRWPRRRLGTRSDMARPGGPGAEHVDLRGATVLPGFVDTHPHLLHFGAFAEPLVDIADARSHDDIVARIRVRAEDTPSDEWIMTTPVGEPHYFLRRSWRDLVE